ncbi:MAG: hypothetical protein WC323_02065 [Patescibacteria group bacterium]|jgi:magnesium-transporting ATPase (P-type)
METWMMMVIIGVFGLPTVVFLLLFISGESSSESNNDGNRTNWKRIAIYAILAIICFWAYIVLFSFSWKAVLFLVLLSALVILANMVMGVDTVPKIKTWAIAGILIILAVIAIHEYSSIKTVKDLRSFVSQVFAATPQPTPPSLRTEVHSFPLSGKKTVEKLDGYTGLIFNAGDKAVIRANVDVWTMSDLNNTHRIPQGIEMAMTFDSFSRLDLFSKEPGMATITTSRK